MDRSLTVKPPGYHYVFEVIKILLLLGALGVLIGVLICLCQLKGTADDIHKLVKQVTPLLPCLGQAFCAPQSG